MYAAGLTDTGKKREQNQDAIFVSNEPIGPLPNLYILADGMGGHNAGDVASTKAVDHVKKYIQNFKAAKFVKPENFLDLLVTATQEANGKVFAMSEKNENMRGMGTTLIACTIHDGKIMMVHVGDSRAYVVSPTGITQITQDHTFVQQMLEKGQLTEAQASVHPKRHVITKALGIAGPLEVDGIVRLVGDAKTIILCSDGLSDMLDDPGIKNIVDVVGFPEQRVKFLIEEANMRGGYDNISAILIDVQ